MTEVAAEVAEETQEMEGMAAATMATGQAEVAVNACFAMKVDVVAATKAKREMGVGARVVAATMRAAMVREPRHKKFAMVQQVPRRP